MNHMHMCIYMVIFKKYVFSPEKELLLKINFCVVSAFLISAKHGSCKSHCKIENLNTPKRKYTKAILSDH